MTHILCNRRFPRVVIASGSPFYRNGGRVWLPAIEWKSLQQWWEFLDDVVLLKPEFESPQVPDGWVELVEKIGVHRLCLHGDRYFARKRAALHEACELLRQSDVLLARMPYYETAWCYQVAKKKRMRFVLESHGDWETSVLEEDKNTLLRKATRRFRASANRRAVLEMTANATCVLGVGPELVNKWVPENVPSLVSTNHLLSAGEYCRREDFSLKMPPRILFVGDMQRRKGLHILFEALFILKNSGRPFLMVLVGAGPMIEELNDYASLNGFQSSVQFTGKVPHGPQLYEYFRQSDVFILPSVAAEGVPRVTHEAMAFGCPVIATDIGSVSWQLQGGAGIIVPPGNTDSLARAICRVLDDAVLRRNLSQKGFQRSVDYTYEKQKVRIAEFVRTCINNGTSDSKRSRS
ncbi:glycosyltransferase family 4 protein [Planctomycetota bacterium]